MNELQLNRVIRVFEEMEEDKLNPFSSEEKMPSEYRDEWNSSLDDPKYTNIFLESLKNGEVPNREEFLQYFDLFCTQCEEFIKSLDDAEVLLGLFYRFQKKYKQKVREALNTEDEQNLEIINSTLKKMNFYLTNFTNFGRQLQQDETQVFHEDTHNIPTKIYPN